LLREDGNTPWNAQINQVVAVGWESSQKSSSDDPLRIPVFFALCRAVACRPVVHLSKVSLAGLKAAFEPGK
jgi:hypothetical protein